MSGFTLPTWLPALLLLAAAATIAVIADRLAALARLDRGLYWTRVTAWTIPLFTLGLLHAWWLKWLRDDLWRTGRHAMPDASGGLAFGPEGAYWIALCLPLVPWLLALTVAHFPRGTEPQHARWLAGAIGRRDTRTWVLVIPVLALLVPLLAGAASLGPASAPYPAALWSALALTLATLVGVALSKDPPARVRTPKPQPAPPPPLPDWPDAMRRQGFTVTTLASYPATAQIQTAPPPGGLAGHWPELSRHQPTPELFAAIEEFLNTADGTAGACNRLILAPEDCGQIESLALAAQIVRRRAQATTLVLVPAAATAFATTLTGWLADAAAVDAPCPGAAPHPRAFVWVTDAEALSSRLIPKLEQDRALLHRVGLIVFWDLHSYSGVPAANFWAISQRLHRLTSRHGRRDLRHLAFVRAAHTPDARFIPFLGESLPQRFPPETQVVIPPRLALPLSLHLLEPTTAASAGAETRPPVTEAVLGAARASVTAGWPTYAVIPEHLDHDEAGAFLQQTVAGRPLRACLEADNATAGAEIREVGAAEVLSLALILAAGGRAVPGLRSRHAGLCLAFGNPYVGYALRRLMEDPAALFRRSRTLVATGPQPGVVQRHLLLALNELPEVTSGLMASFHHEGSEIQRVLRQLASKGLIDRRDVRHLKDGRLVAELEFSGRITRDFPRPLDTVGTDLVAVIDPAAGEGEPRLLSLDPERITIRAYPQRVFVHAGRRYRVQPWGSVAAVLDAQGGDGAGLGTGILCRREQAAVSTWRVFAPRLGRIAAVPGRQRIAFGHLPLARSLVTLDYQEDISGYLEYARDPVSGTWTAGQGGTYNPISSLSMHTQGLFLEIEAERLRDFPSGLNSLAQALRHSLPVHVGIAEDDIAIVACEGRLLAGRPAWGLLFVDLYPGGIGLAQAIEADQGLVEQLLADTRAWLSACPCASAEGCPACLRSPLGRAHGGLSAQPPYRGEALGILAAILD